MKTKGKYIFFDIECSNGHNICSFGYAIISEKLRVLLKQDLIINPESKFILAPKGKRPKMELAYPEELFFKQDNFTCFYNDIKKLLSEESYILIGHSIQSDFHFLRYACQRYNLPFFDMQGYDMQKIYHKEYNTPHVESLEKIIEHLEIDDSKLTFHRSCDDALATFYVARGICKDKDITLDELLARNPDCLSKTSTIFAEKEEKQTHKKNLKKVQKNS
ncbi:MAG: hypothetical protein E7379_00140 [Clostridiales bacterium]|nr:hypothetical protein [Clostridiales bacterium]